MFTVGFRLLVLIFVGLWVASGVVCYGMLQNGMLDTITAKLPFAAPRLLADPYWNARLVVLPLDALALTLVGIAVMIRKLVMRALALAAIAATLIAQSDVLNGEWLRGLFG